MSCLQVIDSINTYFRVLEENPDNIVVIKVYAGFCRACKAFDRKYRTLALEYEEAQANVRFCEMDWMQTRDLCKSLQVRDWERGEGARRKGKGRGSPNRQLSLAALTFVHVTKMSLERHVFSCFLFSRYHIWKVLQNEPRNIFYM